MRVVVHPKAEEEAVDAAAWLERERAGYGDRFIAAVLEARATLRKYPEIGSARSGRARHLRIAGFPYDVVYRLRRDHILIVAVAHHRRHPRFWSRRR